ncbi:hypothetical protein BGX38DRAFT_1204712 [Terfezia claveryi]|nr:hypothetical protein BGX38DRAFT_1204712 [Terfezia claveryi]
MPLMLDGDVFKSFFAYCRLDGPIATIGFAEIRGLTGGFGYNSTLRFPKATEVPDFPFIAVPDSSTPAEALSKLLDSGWFSPKRDSYWVAAGFTVMAFEMLEVSVVAAAEFSPNVKLGIFGLATAEMPKKGERKFVRVQLGVAATIDFGAGILTVDGQLTPASFVLDPSCHLYGGFALYSWFGSRDSMQGNWVFTVGGYHAAFKPPSQYPNPPRLGISWNFDSSINITGEAYFAITPKMCMGGGKLSITLSLGPLSAYFNAWADFLINYKPFWFMASGGITVGVDFVLDLWLVTIHISIDLGATLYLEGPPIAGKVHVDFYVFGFDVEFGHRDAGNVAKLDLDTFYKQVLQTDSKAPATNTMHGELDGGDCGTQEPAPYVFSCTSGLLSDATQNPHSSPNSDPWTVRGAIFAFMVTCKFAVKKATVLTGSPDSNAAVPEDKVVNPAKAEVHARPMGLVDPMNQSTLEIKITPVLPKSMVWEDTVPLNPRWNKNEAVMTSVPCALWGKYDESLDPTRTGNTSELLDGSSGNTVDLMTGVKLYSPEPRRSPDIIAEFDVEKSMGQIAGFGAFPNPEVALAAWSPLSRLDDKLQQFKEVGDRWLEPDLGLGAAMDAVKVWALLEVFGWDLTEPRAVDGKIPKGLVDKISELYTEAPAMCVGLIAVAA